MFSVRQRTKAVEGKMLMLQINSTISYTANFMSDKRDLLIHYDEERQKFVFYMVAVGDTLAIREKTFDGVRPDVAFFKEKSADEAERTLGWMVFSALDLGSINPVNIRDYEAESQASLLQWIEELEIAANDGDSEAQYNLYIQYHVKTLELGRESDLQRTEELLFASVKGGYAPAIKALESWPLVKDAAERRIKRGTAD